MGSSCQTCKSCRTYTPPDTNKGARRQKGKHLKRLGRTNTVVNGGLLEEELKVKDAGPIVRRPQQHTSVHQAIRGVDLARAREAANEGAILSAPAEDTADKELKSLTQLEKDQAGERELFLLKEAFSRHFLLGNISLNAIDSILKEMDYFKLEPNTTLFDQGATGMHLFILTKGMLEVQVNDETVSLVSEGNAFGEIALIYSCQRTAKIKSKDEE